MAKYRLYSDSGVFNREYPGNASLAAIMAGESIPGRARLQVHDGNRREYRVDKTGFQFSIIDVH